MEQQVTFTAPQLRFVGEKHFTRFKNEFTTYRAAGGKASLFSLIRVDTLSIYKDISASTLDAPEGREPGVVEEEERVFLQSLNEHYGNKSTLDTFYSLDAVKLKEINEDKVAAYVSRYKSILRRLAEDEPLSDKTLTEQFLKGIKHTRFRLRMKAALEGGYKDMSGLTRLIFQQVQMVLETLEDAKGYLEEPRRSRFTDKGFGNHDHKTSVKTSSKPTRRDSKSKSKDVTCFNCGKKGHYASECTSKAKKDVTCFNCGKQGHYASECTSKDKKTDGSYKGSFRPVINLSKPDSPYLEVFLTSGQQDKEISRQAILDTGAVFNIISERIYRDLCLKEKVKLQPCNLE
ncbi:hypothetical protein ADUPG1_011400, partial [Aduncisulcus paluster]